MAIAQFSFGSPNDKLTAGQILPAGSRLNSRPVDGTPCKFKTAFDVALLPLEVQSAALESPAPKDARGNLADSSIRISMRCFGDSNLQEMKLGETDKPPEFLRFYLDGDPQLVFPLFEIIFNHATTVEFRPVDTPISGKTMKTLTNIRLKLPDPVVFPADEVIRHVGFADNEALLPYTKRSFAGYRLLTEYFSFPYKFLFFDLYGLDQAIARKFGSHFEVVIRLKDIKPPAAPVTGETFRMGCSPIVNLFSKMSDPIYLSQQKYEYQILPDVHRQSTTEIYSVDDVITTDPRSNTTREFSPFYSMRHAYGDKVEKSFWYAVRRASQRPDDSGTEVFMSLVDLNLDPSVPPVEVLNVRATCTNRDLPARLPFGGKDSDFEVEGAVVLSRVRCLTKPTETIRLPQRRSAQWRLISHLSLNYLSLVNEESGKPEALQEILQLYNYADSVVSRKQILGITGIASRKVIRQIGGRI